MTHIAINDLSVPGLDLLSDEESYLNEISENELNLTVGGFSPVLIVSAAVGGLALTYEASKATREIHDKNKGIIKWL